MTPTEMTDTQKIAAAEMDDALARAHRQMDDLAAALNDAGVNAKTWCKAGKFRVYLRGYGKDITAYFDLPEEDAGAEYDRPWDGTALKVWSDTRQTRSWKTNRCKQVKHTIMEQVADLIGITVPHDWRNVIL